MVQVLVFWVLVSPQQGYAEETRMRQVQGEQYTIRTQQLLKN